MAIAADAPVRPDGIQPGRGGFMRNALDVPYVTDPTGALVKSGERKGQPKRLPYSSTSGFGKLIENGGALEKWSERNVVHGIAFADLAELFDAYRRCDDDGIRKTIADEIVMRAKAEAKSSLAADRGTHAHSLTECICRGQAWRHLYEAGEALGITREQQDQIVACWSKMLVEHGLVVHAIEASVVDDVWHCAGTLDRIVSTSAPLTFALKSGEIVTIPADTYVVLDLKTGSVRKQAAIQLASYAQSQPYDTEAETRDEWPWPVSRQHALIAHMSIDLGTCELVYVDLVAGREHGGACVVEAKAWDARSNVFSVANLTDLSAASPAAAETPPEAAAPVAPPVAPLDPADQHEAVRSRPAPDEGDPVDDPTFDVLQREYVALPSMARTWISALTSQAQQAGVGFHAKGNRTTRRYELIRALVILCQQDGGNDQNVRDLLEPIIGDCAQFPSVPVGHLVGSLSATEAALFSGLVDGRHQILFLPNGKPTLRTAA